jgi:hypothetical protein
VQFPFVLLNRALLHHAVVAGRTHAQRGVLKIAEERDQAAVTARFSAGATRELARLFERLRRSEPGSESRAAALIYLTNVITQFTQGEESGLDGR